MVRKLSIALAFVALAPGAQAAIEQSDKFTHEGWSGVALTQDGRFMQCVMWSSAINNWDIGLSLSPGGGLQLGLRNQRIDVFWDSVFGTPTALRIQIDDGPVLTKAFKASSKTQISTSLNDTDWDKRLPTGKLFRVNLGSRVRVIHLTGIKEAWPKLQACVAKHRA
jgi:hypothetical protein